MGYKACSKLVHAMECDPCHKEGKEREREKWTEGGNESRKEEIAKLSFYFISKSK